MSRRLTRAGKRRQGPTTDSWVSGDPLATNTAQMLLNVYMLMTSRVEGRLPGAGVFLGTFTQAWSLAIAFVSPAAHRSSVYLSYTGETLLLSGPQFSLSKRGVSESVSLTILLLFQRCVEFWVTADPGLLLSSWLCCPRLVSHLERQQ